jgi:hypothetical protein
MRTGDDDPDVPVLPEYMVRKIVELTVRARPGAVRRPRRFS